MIDESSLYRRRLTILSVISWIGQRYKLVSSGRNPKIELCASWKAGNPTLRIHGRHDGRPFPLSAAGFYTKLTALSAFVSHVPR